MHIGSESRLRSSAGRNYQCHSFTWCPRECGPVSKCVSHVFLLAWRRWGTSPASPVVPGAGSISLILTHMKMQLALPGALPSSSAAGREPGHAALLTNCLATTKLLRGKKVRTWFGVTGCFFTIDFQHFVFMSLSFPAALKCCSVVDFWHPTDLYYYLGGSFATRADSINRVINKLWRHQDMMNASVFSKCHPMKHVFFQKTSVYKLYLSNSVH